MPPLKVKDKHLIALAIGQSITCTTQAAVITVNSTLDNVNQGANICTLRDAINLANLEDAPQAPGSALNGCENPSIGPDTIVLPPSATFTVDTSGFNAFTLSSNITFNGNNAEINVSGVRRIFYVQASANVTLNNITLSGGGLSGTSFLGGAMYVSGIATLNNSIVTDNAAGAGGGIYSKGGLYLNGSTVSGNSATATTGTSGGGGLFTGTGGNTFLTNSTVSGNRAASGAGIHNSRSSLVAENSTFSANVGHSPIGNNLGHEFYNGFMGVATFINSTVAGATSTSSIQSQNRLTLKNSIVVNSVGTACVSANVEADASNIISDGSCSTNALAVDPQLMPLAENGGPNLTHALRATSPARNRGAVSDCPSTDQRGVERTLSGGSCDIGSFEFIDDEACFVVRAAKSNVVTFCL